MIGDVRRPPVRIDPPHYQAMRAQEFPARRRAIGCWPLTPGAGRRQKLAAGCWRIRGSFPAGSHERGKRLAVLLSPHFPTIVVLTSFLLLFSQSLGLVFFGRQERSDFAIIHGLAPAFVAR